jgi:1-acyl-sn-glycerol-3-phosphate acyltransferase
MHMTFISYILRYSIALIILIVTHSLAIIISPLDRNIAWRILGIWSRLFMRLFRITLTIENENSGFSPETGGGGYVIISLNQQSLLEVPLSFAMSPRPFLNIFNIEYALIPFIGWVAWIFGLVIVRQWPKQSRSKGHRII